MDDEDFYVENNKFFEKMFKYLNYDFLDDYSLENLSELMNIFNKISDYNKRFLYGGFVKSKSIVPIFIEVIKDLGDKRLLDYYLEKVSEIPMERTRLLSKNNSCLEHYFLEDYIKFSAILVPKGLFRYSDVASYAHEMGHVADMENKNREKKDYYEYSEVLSILLEYFTFLKLMGNRGDNIFYRERLVCERNASKAAISSINRLKSEFGSSDEHKYYTYDIADSNKYLRSSDFAFQFIDLLGEDRAELCRLLTSTLMGERTVAELGESLDINTDGCKRLVKEYEKRKRR